MSGQRRLFTRTVVLIFSLFVIISLFGICNVRSEAATNTYNVAVKLAKKATAKTVKITKGGRIQIVSSDGTSSIAKDKLKYSSNKTSIATVSKKGVITTKKAGTAKISISTKNGKLKAVLTVKVTNSKVAVKSVKLSKSKLTLLKGKSATLKTTISPETATKQKVTWSSSNSKVVKVSGGKLTAVKNGTATIKAKVDGKTASCVVTVKTPNVAVSKVKLDNKKVSMVKGETYQLNATVAPSNATNKKVTWSSSDKAIATVSETGLITAREEGTVTITCKSKADSSKIAKCTVKIITGSGTFGADNLTWALYKNGSSTYTLEIGGTGTIEAMSSSPWGYRNTGVKREQITKLITGSGVKRIGENAFYAYDGLTTLELSEGLQSIGKQAFFTVLTLSGTIHIPSSVTTIEESAFCMTGTIYSDMDCGITGRSFGSGSKLTTIEDNAFRGLGNMTGDIVFPDSLVTIGEEAFYLSSDEAKGFHSVYFGKNSKLESIGDRAFSTHNALEVITFPKTLQYVGTGFGTDNIRVVRYRGTKNEYRTLMVTKSHAAYNVDEPVYSMSNPYIFTATNEADQTQSGATFMDEFID